MNKAIFTKDIAAKRITVVRSFDAPLERTWAAWTDSSILDQWWGPQPWRAETKEQTFKEGGRWLYSMVGPNGERHWSKADYITIDPMRLFRSKDMFCDAEGNPNPDMPGSSTWNVSFEPKGSATEVTIQLDFSREEDMRMIVEMGFEGGFTIGMNQLDELFASGK